MSVCGEVLDISVEWANVLLIIFPDLQNNLWSLPFVHNLIKLQALERKYFLKLIQCDAIQSISENVVGDLGMGKSHYSKEKCWVYPYVLNLEY